MKKLIKLGISNQLFLPVFALLMLILYNAIFVPDFFSISIINGQFHGRIVDILSRSSALIVATIGITFVIATGGIDISIGSVIAIVGAVAAYLIGSDVGVAKMPFLLVIIISLIVGAICGMWNAFLVSKLKIQPIVATLILQTAGRGIAMLITQGQILTVYYKPFSYIGNYLPNFPIPTTILIALFVIIFIFMLLRYTALGLLIQSVGINRRASMFSGVKVSGLLILVYTFSGICAAIAGLIEVSMISAADANNAGLHFEASAILSVALGGTLLSGGKFTLPGSIIGAITIQTLTTTMYANGVSSVHLPVIQGAVIILICLLQSQTFKRLFSRKKSKAVQA